MLVLCLFIVPLTTCDIQICLLANLLLFLGLVLPLRPLLIPWLTAHSLLCVALACAFVHYLGNHRTASKIRFCLKKFLTLQYVDPK